MIRAARRMIVRAWECARYDVQTFGPPTVDDVVRSRVLGRARRAVDLLERRRDLLASPAAWATADRLRAILETSSAAYPVEPQSESFEVAWRFEHDGDSPTPFERARAIRAAREVRS